MLPIFLPQVIFVSKIANSFGGWRLISAQAEKNPWQLYIDAEDGALQYAKPGQLPRDAISVNFDFTSDNPEGDVAPTPAFFTWPSTQLLAAGTGSWLLCPKGESRWFKVYTPYFTPQGVPGDGCKLEELAALNA
ncbi:hypothetical protein K469DRAFT_278639 [Zopfia rhizophila CBS 207.26]|uniref:Uncharacterized protein n=1 Tax=Zopfia rhizophila CBS 207.26 TaxID=1314779 RepID=A0A6A6DPV3_9PEZI|nr:hypothetical protein K469DRAFT_278639 [Zopfia rhizophila CBS 207.26]